MLISAVFQNRKPVLKFYEPNTNRIILIEDTTNYKAHLYVTPIESQHMENMMGVENIKEVEIFDVIKDKHRTMSKVTVNNPMLKFDMQESGQGWETDIKFYQDYLYDNNYVCGTWYDIDIKTGLFTPIVNDNTTFDLSSINMDSVVDKKMFSDQLKKWANLLSQSIPHIRRMAFDIEVESKDENKLPDPSTAINRVTAISFCSSDGIKKVFLLKRPEMPLGTEDEKKDYELILYDNEKEMLKDSFELIDSYPVILTYNGDVFDMPYLYNRANILEIEYNPFRMMQKKATLNSGVHIDLYGVFSNRSLKTYAFDAKYVEEGLDPVSEAMLGEKKIEFDGNLQDIPLYLLAKYCYNDSRLTYELSHFDDDMVMKLLIILSRISNMPIDDVNRLSISKWIKSMFYFEHRSNKQLIPKSSDFPRVGASTIANIKDKKYKGATVIEPVKGIHFGVTVLDFASLYPSIIKNKNCSYETICCPHDECKSNLIPNTVHWSCTKKIGVASLLIGSLKELRVSHFKVLAKGGKTQEERDINHVIAQALKVYLNASYGVIGSDVFPLYFLPTAEAVTAVGRDIISKTIKTAESKSLPVLYGDTDSIFVYQPTKEQIDYLIDFCRQEYSIDLEVDKEYKYLVLSDRKKNYFGVKKDNTLDIKGLAGKKSNTPPYLKELFYSTLEKLKVIEVPSDFPPIKKEIETNIRNTILNFDNIPIKKLALRVMIQKEIGEYKIKPQAVKAAEQLGKAEKGMFISFVKTWNGEKVKPISLATNGDIDKDKYMENLKSVFEQITDPMSIDMDFLLSGKRKTKLDDFW